MTIDCFTSGREHKFITNFSKSMTKKYITNFIFILVWIFYSKTDFKHSNNCYVDCDAQFGENITSQYKQKTIQ